MFTLRLGENHQSEMEVQNTYYKVRNKEWQMKIGDWRLKNEE